MIHPPYMSPPSFLQFKMVSGSMARQKETQAMDLLLLFPKSVPRIRVRSGEAVSPVPDFKEPPRHLITKIK